MELVTLPELLQSLSDGGFTCRLFGRDAVEIIGPVDGLTPEIRDALRWHKPSLLVLLQPRADSYGIEERWAIQREGEFPPEAADWPEELTWAKVREAATTGVPPDG